MFVSLLVAVVGGLIVLPHVTRLERTAPATATALWVVALGLRALLGVSCAVYLVLFLPATAVFESLTQWCWHTILPPTAAHVMLTGHGVGDLISLLPGLLLVGSVASMAFGLIRAVRTVHRLVVGNAIGRGPRDSVIVSGSEVFVAAAGLARPQVVISAGALTALDDDELAASLDHERGHIDRRHRFVVLYGELCQALGFFIPGVRSAVRQLIFHLERDADAWSLARSNSRLALASAICKAALRPATTTPNLAALGGGGGVTERVGELLDGGSRIGGVRATLLNAFALFGLLLLLGLTVAVPVTLAARDSSATAEVVRACRR